MAEDQSLILAALAKLLGLESDLDVVGCAADGLEALELVLSYRPDVLVTDIEMPGLSGLEVAEHLAREKSATKVVIVTTFDRAGYLRRALDAGVQGYLLKDAHPDQLGEAIRRVAGGGRAIAPELSAVVWDTQADPLNSRDRMLLRFAEEGLTNKAIAERLNLSPGTVRNYLSEAASKLNVSSRIEASRLARLNGWL